MPRQPNITSPRRSTSAKPYSHRVRAAAEPHRNVRSFCSLQIMKLPEDTPSSDVVTRSQSKLSEEAAETQRADKICLSQADLAIRALRTKPLCSPVNGLSLENANCLMLFY